MIIAFLGVDHELDFFLLKILVPGYEHEKIKCSPDDFGNNMNPIILWIIADYRRVRKFS